MRANLMTDINRTTDGICIYKPEPCSKVVAQSDRIWSKFSIERKEKKVCLLFLHNKCSPNILFGWQIIVIIYKSIILYLF